ncbi:hypothetical protein [Micromonospora sp. NPDC023814]|uniref:hypothetical protein n=1 Tax=Micromonospora sp. NPDC023814 TaxID=3154596 RepID=UPI0033D18791
MIRLAVRYDATISDGWQRPATRSASTCTTARANCSYAKVGDLWVPLHSRITIFTPLRRPELWCPSRM